MAGSFDRTRGKGKRAALAALLSETRGAALVQKPRAALAARGVVAGMPGRCLSQHTAPRSGLLVTAAAVVTTAAAAVVHA
ncbi:MAG TPA: hypothetical protein VN715_02760, partial [Roseiarcus sp.]|nr:hypothetical protein [Roseiarcus sp.]